MAKLAPTDRGQGGQALLTSQLSLQEKLNENGSANGSALQQSCAQNSYSTENARAGQLQTPEVETASWELLGAVMLICISPLLFGISIAFTSPTQGPMEGDKQGGISPPSDLVEFTPNSEKWYASLFNIGAVVGAFTGSWMSDRFGRKNTVAFTAIPHMIAWGGTALAHSGGLLLALRILCGWAVGIGSAVTPCYIGEVATTRLRGALGAANQLSITIGIFVVAVLGNDVFLYTYEGQNFSNWRSLAWFAFVLSFLLLFMACMPESPRWLAKTGQVEKVPGQLRRLRSSRIEFELDTILSESSHSTTPAVVNAPMADNQQTSLTQADQQTQPSMFTTYRTSFIIGIGLCLFQQFTGANAVMMYINKICIQAKISNPELAALLAMGAQVVFTAMACMLIDKAGRRPLLMLACTCMILSHGILCYYYVALGHGWFSPSWLALAALFIFIFGFSMGMGPIPWLILSEIFPTEVRSTASSYAIVVNWLSSFVVTLFFQPVTDAITSQGVFALFAGISVAASVFTYVLVPETKGKTVDQVLAELKGRGGARAVATT